MLNRPRRIRFGRTGDHSTDRLVLGDNLPVLTTLGDESFDAIYIDPPFGTGSTRRGQGVAYRDADSDPDTFITWLEPRLAHCRRVLKATGSLFVHLDYRTVHYVKVALDRLFGRSHLVNEIIWCYSVGGKSRRRFARKHDTILWYARGSDYAFYPDAVRIPRKPASHMRVVRTEDGDLVQEKTDRKTGKVYRYPVSRGKVPEDWWTDIETLNRGDRERTGWPTQKPERLVERILRSVTRPGDAAADFFCGSGTTPVVAQRLDVGFVATDRQPDAIACAGDRLELSGRELAAAGSPPRNLDIEASPQQARVG